MTASGNMKPLFIFMTTTEPIFGGYYLKARKFNNSKIAHCVPHIREIWDWLIMNANHKPYTTKKGTTINRGQILTTYKDIQEGLHWYDGFIKKTYKKHHVDTTMRTLRAEAMVTTRKTTLGIIITICNYDIYQNPDNYKKDNGNDSATATTIPLGRAIINKNVNNANNEKENIIGGKGGFAPPTAPQTVFKAPDGSFVIEPLFTYKASDFNGLPTDYAELAKGQVKLIKKVDVEISELKTLWDSFKILELHKKAYRNKEEVYGFFISYCKRQPWLKGSKPRAQKTTTTKSGKSHGVEFINDFAECRMSDGSVVELDINQRDLARFNSISPSSIIR